MAGVTARAPFAVNLMQKWTKSKKDSVRQAGYWVLASRLKRGLDIPDVDCKRYVKTIEREIHGSGNWARSSLVTGS